MDPELKEFHSFIKGQFSSYNIKDFEKIENWSSLQTLVVLSAIDEKYGILIPYEDLNQMKSLEDMYHFIQSK